MTDDFSHLFRPFPLRQVGTPSCQCPQDFRTDFRVTSELGVSEYDLTIISLSTQDTLAADKKNNRDLPLSNPSNSLLDLSKASIQSSLQTAVQKKNTKYTRFLIVPFHPIVILLEGMLEDKAVKELEKWKKPVWERVTNSC
jgi:hypothetical protein